MVPDPAPAARGPVGLGRSLNDGGQKMFSQLKIERFGLHESTELDFEAPAILFVGPNEHGKSTIRQAGRFLLDGQIVDEELLTMVKKQLHGDFIRNAGKATNFEISGTTVVNGKVYALSRKQTKSKSSGSPALDLDRDVLNCLFNSKYYARMDPNARAKLWFQVLGLELGLEDLKKEIKKRVPSVSVLDQTEIGNIYLTFEKAGFDRAENAAVEMRRGFKRVLEKLPEDPPAGSCEIEFLKDGDVEIKEIKFANHSVDGVEQALSDARADLQKLKDERRKLEGRRSESADHIRSALTEALKNIEKLEVEVEDLKAASPELEVIDEKRKSILEEWESVREEIRELETEIETIEKMQDWTEDCPLYPDAKCRSKGQIEKILADKRKAAGGLKRSRTAKQRKHDQLKADLDELQSQRNQSGENARLYLEKTQRLAYYKAEVDRLEKLKKDAGAFSKPDAERLAGLDPEIANAEGRVHAYQNLFDKIVKYELNMETFDESQKIASDYQSKINAADELAVALGSGPKGIRATLTKKARSEVNELLGSFKVLLGRSVSLDESLSVAMDDVPYEHLLSHSARRRLGIAIQAAIAQLTGLKFFAVDDLENLDPARRNDMLAAAINLGKSGKFQIWLFCSLGDRETNLLIDALPIAGLEIFRVESGKVSKLEGKN